MGRLNAILSSLVGVQPDAHQFYEQINGVYLLAVDGIEDVRGLKSALEKEREARKELKREYVLLLTKVKKQNRALEAMQRELETVSVRVGNLLTELKEVSQ